MKISMKSLIGSAVLAFCLVGGISEMKAQDPMVPVCDGVTAVISEDGVVQLSGLPPDNYGISVPGGPDLGIFTSDGSIFLFDFDPTLGSILILIGEMYDACYVVMVPDRPIDPTNPFGPDGPGFDWVQQ